MDEKNRDFLMTFEVCFSLFFNKGPEFLAGIPRHSHFRPYKLLAAVVIPGLLLVAALAPANGTSGATKS